MKRIDLNADLGEMDTPEGHASDAAILGVVSSAPIACGGHAGDRDTMRRAVGEALRNGVRIGAHPAYPDRANFGRQPGFPISHEDLQNTLMEQVTTLAEVAAEAGAEVAYVKPHGALYNDAVADAGLADVVAQTVAALDPNLALMGAPNSEMGRAAESAGLAFLPEGFIDRRYSDAGHLVSRRQSNAILDTDAERLVQMESLVRDGEVVSETGRRIALGVATLCLHGDSPGARDTARAARARLEQLGFEVRA